MTHPSSNQQTSHTSKEDSSLNSSSQPNFAEQQAHTIQTLVLEIVDEMGAIYRMLDCFSQLFLLISCQPEPLDSKALGTISDVLEEACKRMKKLEKMIQRVAPKEK